LNPITPSVKKSFSDIFASLFSINNAYASTTSSNLSVFGKVGIGILTPFMPTEKLDVVGNVKVGSLENTAAQSVRLCADSLGKIILCPSGSKTFNVGQSTDWTVPDGVFRINVKVIGGGGGGGGAFNTNAGGAGGGGGGGGYSEGNINLIPGQIVTVYVGKGGLGGSNVRAGSNYILSPIYNFNDGRWYGNGDNGGDGESSSFGSYFSVTGGGGGKASYKTNNQWNSPISSGAGGTKGTGANLDAGFGTSGCGGGGAGGTSVGVIVYARGAGGRGESPCNGTSSAANGTNGSVVVTWTNLIN